MEASALYTLAAKHGRRALRSARSPTTSSPARRPRAAERERTFGDDGRDRARRGAPSGLTVRSAGESHGRSSSARPGRSGGLDERRRCARSRTRPAPARPARRQLGPGQPVERELERVGSRPRGWSSSRRPGSSSPAGRRLGVHRVDPAAHHLAARAPARTAPPRRSGTRSANGPVLERRDQLAQVGVVVDARVAAARAGRRGRTGPAGRSGLDPGVEAGAEAGRRRRLPRHRPGQVARRSRPGRRAAGPARSPTGSTAGARRCHRRAVAARPPRRSRSSSSSHSLDPGEPRPCRRSSSVAGSAASASAAVGDPGRGVEPPRDLAGVRCDIGQGRSGRAPRRGWGRPWPACRATAPAASPQSASAARPSPEVGRGAAGRPRSLGRSTSR